MYIGWEDIKRYFDEFYSKFDKNLGEKKDIIIVFVYWNVCYFNGKVCIIEVVELVIIVRRWGGVVIFGVLMYYWMFVNRRFYLRI